jgi:penicillin-binding protein 2
LVIYGMRLFFLQVIDPSYKLSAENNVFRHITQYPSRGLLFDRHGELLVYNQPVYDLLVVPNEVKAFDTTLLCNIVGITKQDLINKIKDARIKNTGYKPSIIIQMMDFKKYSLFQENLYNFQGFFAQHRTMRSYTRPIAASIFGYIGEVDTSTIKVNPYYKMGDYIGISGIEKYYEKDLRGKKGVKIFMVDVHNRIKGSAKEGKYDTLAYFGSNLTTTIDADLQAYGESLLVGKRGSIVAIEPSTGEILALITNPTYDPNLLIGDQRAKNYRKLQLDPSNLYSTELLKLCILQDQLLNC